MAFSSRNGGDNSNYNVVPVCYFNLPDVYRECVHGVERVPEQILSVLIGRGRQSIEGEEMPVQETKSSKVLGQGILRDSLPAVVAICNAEFEFEGGHVSPQEEGTKRRLGALQYS